MAFPLRAPDLSPFLCPEADFCGPKRGETNHGVGMMGPGLGLWGRDWDYGITEWDCGIMGWHFVHKLRI